MSYESPVLKRRLDLFEDIPAAAKHALRDVMEPPVAIAKNDRLREAGGLAEEFWIVEEGWFYASSRLADSGRQVYAFYLPGDVMGLQDLGWDTAVCDVTAATAGRIVRIDKLVFRQVVNAYPVLAGFFLTYGIYDHTQLIDRLRCVGRMEAIKRVGHLLLQLLSGQAEPGGIPPGAAFVLPIDQALIGDAIGLTNISVSRMMSELEARGLIAREGRRVTIPDVAALSRFCEFTDRRRAVPLSWLLAGR